MENVVGLGFPLEKATSAPGAETMLYYRGCDEDDGYGYGYNHVRHTADEIHDDENAVQDEDDECGEKTVMITDGDGDDKGNDKQQCDKGGRLRPRSRRRLVGSLLRRAFHRIRPRPSLSSLPVRWESGVERRDYGVADEWERVSYVERRDYGVPGKSEREWEGGGASFERPQVCMLPLSPLFFGGFLIPPLASLETSVGMELSLLWFTAAKWAGCFDVSGDACSPLVSVWLSRPTFLTSIEGH